MGTDVAWLLELAVNPGELPTVRALMSEMVDAARAEAGTLSYAWYISDDESAVALYERFADDDAALAHLNRVVEQFAQRFLGAMTPTRCSVFGDPSDAV